MRRSAMLLSYSTSAVLKARSDMHIRFLRVRGSLDHSEKGGTKYEKVHGA
jgi:hypothetical protein